MIPKADGDATPLGQRPLSLLPIVYRVWVLLGWVSLMDGFGLGYLILSLVLGVVVGRWKHGILLFLILRRCLAGATDSHLHLFVADVIKSSDTVDRRIFRSGFELSWFAWMVSPCLF